MGSRYFPNSGASHAEVFNIETKDIYKAKRVQRKDKKRKEEQQLNTELRPHAKKKRNNDPFPGKAPVDEEKIRRHERGAPNEPKVKTKWAQKAAERREDAAQAAAELAARAELLLDAGEGDRGFLEGDEDDEFTGRVSQSQIGAAVDSETRAKGLFELNLAQFGPYTVDYTRNGRHLLLGGRRGHVAALEWQSKRLLCEVNVQESVHDVKWLHTENMFAVAQKKWTYIYDNQGIELHCLKKMDNIAQLEFLPYHFLLAGGSTRGFMSWVDVSVGKIVSQFNALNGPISLMTQNPSNAVIYAGHNKGTVTLWTPNQKEPAAKMLAHGQPVRALTIDRTGNYLATAGLDRSLRIWDARMFRMLRDYRLRSAPTHLSFSGSGMLCAAMGDTVEVYKNPAEEEVKYPYLAHKVFKTVSDVGFAPYEDVLGIGHGAGFASILVPGSGEANFDALEVNPYQTKSQRREAEVKALLEKIQPELISLDPTEVGDVNVKKVESELRTEQKKLFVKPKKIDFEPREKAKGKSGTAKRFHIKREVMENERRRDLKKQLAEASDEPRVGSTKKVKKPKALLDRLK